MNKQTGSILLVAGTCIGSGMIALPLVLAKLGIIPSAVLMVLTWLLMYYTSLVNLELNLQAGKGMSLGALGKHFSGPIAASIGKLSLKLLSYALLAVFLYAGASITQTVFPQAIDLFWIQSAWGLMSILILLLPIRLIDLMNRILFISLIGIVFVLLLGLIATVSWAHLPLYSEQWTDWTAYSRVVPVVFTSFGFQVIFHTLSDYCKQDAAMLKKTFFWGSAIPAIVYISWTCAILGAIQSHHADFYSQMVLGTVEVGDLVCELSKITRWHSLQLLVGCVSLLAITTSIIGVGRGLYDTLSVHLRSKIFNKRLLNLTAAVLTLLPSYLVAVWVPNAFIIILGFAGMILAIIAVILPIYLLKTIKAKPFYYPVLKNNYWLYLSFMAGLAVIAAEIMNMLL